MTCCTNFQPHDTGYGLLHKGGKEERRLFFVEIFSLLSSELCLLLLRLLLRRRRAGKIGIPETFFWPPDGPRDEADNRQTDRQPYCDAIGPDNKGISTSSLLLCESAVTLLEAAAAATVRKESRFPLFKYQVKNAALVGSGRFFG
jgi:hypothetical protein